MWELGILITMTTIRRALPWFTGLLLILTMISSWSVLAASQTKAAKRYRYELVQVHGVAAPQLVAARVADGWEPISISFPGGTEFGYILFRK